MFKPTPADPNVRNLRVIELDHGQHEVTNGEGLFGGEFDREYVHMSGYCGPHNPWTFAAAPELLAALKAMVLNDKHTYRDCHKAALAAIAKAEGRS